MKKRLTRILASMLAMLMVLSLAACGGDNKGSNNSKPGNDTSTPGDANAPSDSSGGSGSYKDTLTWCQGSDVTSLDPHQGKETPAVQVTCQIFDTLLQVNPETKELEPQIAESWEQTDDLTYVFKIREGVKFHDGSEVTTADVKFSLDRAINSAAVSYIVDFIESVTDNGDGTVTIKTKAPYGPALRNLAIPFAAIVPKALVEADEANFILNPVGSGPYQFVEWKQGDHVTMKAFDDYYAGKAATENLIMKVVPEAAQRSIALETGEVDVSYDLSVNDIPKVEENPDLVANVISSLSCTYLSFNLNKAPFDNPKVREAISVAIDRQALVDTIKSGVGQPADAIIAPDVFGYYSTGVPEYNPERARELLAEAGYADGFSTTLWVNDNQGSIELCSAIMAMLMDVGIDCELKTSEFGSFISSTSAGEHDIACFGWTTSSGDADYTYYSLEHSSQQGAPGNRSFISDPEVDQLIEDARSSSDEATRKELYQKLAIKLAEYNNNMPILYTAVNVGASKNVEGFVMDVNEYHHLENVRVAQ